MRKHLALSCSVFLFSAAAPSGWTLELKTGSLSVRCEAGQDIAIIGKEAAFDAREASSKINGGNELIVEAAAKKRKNCLKDRPCRLLMDSEFMLQGLVDDIVFFWTSEDGWINDAQDVTGEIELSAYRIGTRMEPLELSQLVDEHDFYDRFISHRVVAERLKKLGLHPKNLAELQDALLKDCRKCDSYFRKSPFTRFNVERYKDGKIDVAFSFHDRVENGAVYFIRLKSLKLKEPWVPGFEEATKKDYLGNAFIRKYRNDCFSKVEKKTKWIN
jgi:hypothetical protein